MFFRVLSLTYHSPITILAATFGPLPRCALAWLRTSALAQSSACSSTATLRVECRPQEQPAKVDDIEPIEVEHIGLKANPLFAALLLGDRSVVESKKAERRSFCALSAAPCRLSEAYNAAAGAS